MQRVAEIKLPVDPESTRVSTDKQCKAVVSVTLVVRGLALTVEVFTTLTAGRGGRMGHVTLTCPEDPQ